MTHDTTINGWLAYQSPAAGWHTKDSTPRHYFIPAIHQPRSLLLLNLLSSSTAQSAPGSLSDVPCLLRAKTIDLCNNPRYKENKLDMAKRVISGPLFNESWVELDDEVKALEARGRSKLSVIA